MKDFEFDPVPIINAEGYVIKNKNEAERKNSSSGGVFILLAKEIISRGGYVCGCVYSQELLPEHIVSNDLSDVYKMMGSKYVVSNLKNCFNEIKTLLSEGKEVLFSGVPCQIDALKRSVTDSDKLLTVGVVCHGSIGRNIYQAFLKEEQKRGEIKSLTMRDKQKGWSNYGMRVTFKDNSEHITFRNEDGYFLKCFTSGIFERDVCLKCKIKGGNIKADILLGDGWGMDKLFPDFDDNLGVSSVLALSQKGKLELGKILKYTEFKQIDAEEIIKRNGRIMTPAPENSRRKKFLKEFAKYPDKFTKLTKKYAKETFFSKLKRKLKF